MKKFKVACIQMCAKNNIEDNVKKIIGFFYESINKKADFILTTENSQIISINKKELFHKASFFQKDKLLKETKKICKKFKKWILLGSIIIKNKSNKLVNRSVLINPKGLIETYYDKIHMFDVQLSNKEKYLESKIYKPGNKIKTARLPWGKIGLTICYDMRFPNMYRIMAKAGIKFISVPSAFTKTTGKKHWHTLLKARSIENFCYIVAPAQIGKHNKKKETYGHSLIISPDGKILNEKKKGEGVIYFDIDYRLPNELRKRIPSLLLN